MNNPKNDLKVRLLKEIDVTRVKVRFNDTDSMGVVHFKNYLVYFDDGFVSFMNHDGSEAFYEKPSHAVHDGFRLLKNRLERGDG